MLCVLEVWDGVGGGFPWAHRIDVFVVLLSLLPMLFYVFDVSDVIDVIDVADVADVDVNVVVC